MPTSATKARHLDRTIQKFGLWSQAIDTQDVTPLLKIARQHGIKLHVPYQESGESWHVEALEPFDAPPGF